MLREGHSEVKPDGTSNRRAQTAELDLAVSPEREINSWVGAGKFSDTGIDELVPSGAIGVK
jgi:hypothetical protein